MKKKIFSLILTAIGMFLLASGSAQAAVSQLSCNDNDGFPKNTINFTTSGLWTSYTIYLNGKQILQGWTWSTYPSISYTIPKNSYVYISYKSYYPTSSGTTKPVLCN